MSTWSHSAGAPDEELLDFGEEELAPDEVLCGPPVVIDVVDAADVPCDASVAGTYSPKQADANKVAPTSGGR